MADSQAQMDLTIADFAVLDVVTFSGGDDRAGTAIAAGDFVTQLVSGATGHVHKVSITSGAFADGDAAGEVYIQATSTTAFAGTDGIEKDGEIGTGGILTPDGTYDPNFDAIFKKMQYRAIVEYTPGAGSPVYPTSALFGPVLSADDLGFDLDANDKLFVPFRIAHGIRPGADEGAFYLFYHWDNSASKGYFHIGFQGLKGPGDGDRVLIPRCILSLDAAADECGDLVALDFSTTTFGLTWESNATAGGGSSSKVPVHSAGDGVFEPV